MATLARMRTAAAVVLAVGALLRLRQYAFARSLYSDEAYVSINVASRSFRDLLHPLTWDQTAPVLFLWAQRLMTLLLGVNEYALRLLPLLAGIALLGILWPLGRKLLGGQPALVAMALAAVLPLLVYHTNEAKPYGIDAMVTALLAYLAVRVIDAPSSTRAWAALAFGGAFCILLSTPAIFVMAGVGIALVLAPGVRRTAGWTARLTGLACVWGVTFVAVYLAFLRATAGNELLRRAFANWFLTPDPATLPHRLGQSLWDVLVPLFFGHGDLVPPKAVSLVVALAALGLADVGRRRGMWVAALLGGPVAAATGASALERWPFIQRTMLFAAPLFVLMVVSGIACLVRLLPRRAFAPALWAAGALFGLPALGGAVRDAIDPPAGPQHARPVIAEFVRRDVGGEPAYISHWGRATWAFYTTDWHDADTARLSWLERAHSPRSAADSTRSLPVTGREDGDPFSRVYRGRAELVQRLPANVLLEYGRPNTPLGVDEIMWATGEAARIRAAARPYAWMYLSGGSPRLIAAVLDATRRLGGRIVYETHRPGADLYRVRFE